MTESQQHNSEIDLPVAVSSTPPLVDLSTITNITDMLVDRLREAPEHIAFETLPAAAALDSPWRQITTKEFMSEVLSAARGLIADGVAPGDKILIMAPTQYLWAVADFAAAFAGAIVVPAYDNAPAAQLRAILNDTKPTVAIAGSLEIARAIAAAATSIGQRSESTADMAATATTRHTLNILVLDDSAQQTSLDTPAHPEPQSSHWDITMQRFSELADLGAQVTDAELETRRLSAQLDDVATIVYTSGTTAAPKGALITHRNLVGQVLNTAAAYKEVVKETGNTILFLPLTHVLGRALQLICVARGMRVAHLSSPGQVVQALPVLRPTFLVVVPRVLEKIQEAAAQKAAQKRLSRVWKAAVATATQWGKYLEQRQFDSSVHATLGLRLRHWVYGRLFYGRLRQVLGGRLAYFLSGAATMNPELGLFYRGIGIPVIEGYGLTETTAPLTGGRPGLVDSSSTGTPLPGNTVAISGRGEILAKGLGVFAGYHNPQQNVGAFVAGYFRTGDLGSIDKNGALQIQGRLKNVIVTSTGRTVSPEDWENSVQQDPLVAHAVLIGNDKPYLTALLVLDPEYINKNLADLDGTELPPLGQAVICQNSYITDLLAKTISAANAAVPREYRAQYWKPVLVKDDHANKFYTPTLKLKRQVLIDALMPEIRKLYQR